MADDTRVHNQGGEDLFDFLNLTLGYNTEKGNYSLLSADVNEEWSEIRKRLEKEIDLENTYVERIMEIHRDTVSSVIENLASHTAYQEVFDWLGTDQPSL